MGKIDINKQRKRDALYDSAFGLFTSRGIHNTSISDIVENAGVAKGTFYLYFKDKYDIRNKLIIHKAAEVFRRADEELQKQDFSRFEGYEIYEERVIFLADNIISQFAQDTTLLKFISKKLGWGMIRNFLAEPEEESEGGYDIYKSVFGGCDCPYEDKEIMVYMIIELVSSTCYGAILFGEPVGIDGLKPYLFRTLRRIMQEHQRPLATP
ncbi:MAG: TetR/AcrR family transcriptional regulator [Lachnospiraceae bacterium]|nr:TetR/AcrR family transcriptional regulator [Lachnospiraceae bacterium]